MLPYAVCWLIAMVIFLVIEGLTATALVSLWFAVGALAALVSSFLVPSFTVQVVVFLIVSCLAFALLRPLVKKRFTPRTEATNAQRFIGAEAVVTQTIDNLAATGQVSLKGQTWTARSRDNVPLEPGTRVTVLAIEGVKVIVQPIE